MSEDDPFEELDEAVEDREGDPFEQLDDSSEESGDSPTEGEIGQSTPEETETGFFTAEDTEPDTGSPVEESSTGWSQNESTDSAGDQRDQGFEEVDMSAEQPSQEPTVGETSEMEFGIGRREHEGTPGAPSLDDVGTREGNPFENVEGAFEQMDTGGMNPDAVWQNLESAESRGSVGDVRERVYSEVSKHSYCEQCEYFSDPPEINCSHEGTDIIEFLDMETVRVVDCPVVAEREELENS